MSLFRPFLGTVDVDLGLGTVQMAPSNLQAFQEWTSVFWVEEAAGPDLT